MHYQIVASLIVTCVLCAPPALAASDAPRSEQVLAQLETSVEQELWTTDPVRMNLMFDEINALPSTELVSDSEVIREFIWDESVPSPWRYRTLAAIEQHGTTDAFNAVLHDALKQANAFVKTKADDKEGPSGSAIVMLITAVEAAVRRSNGDLGAGVDCESVLALSSTLLLSERTPRSMNGRVVQLVSELPGCSEYKSELALQTIQYNSLTGTNFNSPFVDLLRESELAQLNDSAKKWERNCDISTFPRGVIGALADAGHQPARQTLASIRSCLATQDDEQNKALRGKIDKFVQHCIGMIDVQESLSTILTSLEDVDLDVREAGYSRGWLVTRALELGATQSQVRDALLSLAHASEPVMDKVRRERNDYHAYTTASQLLDNSIAVGIEKGIIQREDVRFLKHIPYVDDMPLNR